jgi:ribosomal protein S18 acetylase RimI-like enzyme
VTQRLCQRLKNNYIGVFELITFEKVQTEEEIEEIEVLVQKIWPEVFVPIIGQEQVDYMLEHYQSIANIKEEIDEGAWYYLLRNEEQPVGYLSFALDGDSLFLNKIYLLKEFRGQGYFKKILAFAERQARENLKYKFTLHVNRRNTRAIEVYQHVGFEIVRSIDRTLGKFILDDYDMELILPKDEILFE